MAKAKNHHPQKILVIEDEPALLDIYSTMLRMGGYEVIEAPDGVAGLESAINAAPALILLDILLPLRDGFDVLNDLKMNPKTKDIPVIILSNMGQEYEVKRGLALGAASFLVKVNFTPALIVEEIRKILSPRQGEKP